LRYYLSSCEYKWSHAKTQMEDMWVMRELGQELWKQCNQDGYKLEYIRSKSQSLPDDVYLRCDIYVNVDERKKDSVLFPIKFSQARLTPLAK